MFFRKFVRGGGSKIEIVVSEGASGCGVEYVQAENVDMPRPLLTLKYAKMDNGYLQYLAKR